MTELTDHPYVAEYLRQFDKTAAALPQARRMLLRAEIAEHLGDMIPASASDEEAVEAIAQFGSPAEIVAHEMDEAAPAVAAVPRRRRRWIGWAIAGLLVALLVVFALIAALLVVRGSQNLPASPVLPGNPVVEEPEGAVRVTSGQGYFEYVAAIESMEHPLPDGAEYPLGVPEGLDAGDTADGGLMESGAGATVAHFTWLCAWESEYLAAEAAEDDRRLVDAEAMITNWAESDFYLALGDTEGGWVTNVVAPMRVGDSSGVKQDRTQACAQAGIPTVHDK